MERPPSANINIMITMAHSLAPLHLPFGLTSGHVISQRKKQRLSLGISVVEIFSLDRALLCALIPVCRSGLP
jgi:hypothetical protein